MKRENMGFGRIAMVFLALVVAVGLFSSVAVADLNGVKGPKLDKPSYSVAARFVFGGHTYDECTFVDNFGRELPGYVWNSWTGPRCQPFTSRGHSGSVSGGSSGDVSSEPETPTEPEEEEEDDDSCGGHSSDEDDDEEEEDDEGDDDDDRHGGRGRGHGRGGRHR